ncbi:DUF2243 domain-containing protein [Egicoccus halophilus]|uniref:Membrane protein n=1 Tax=Egicoccus halophilus TaxID=1670830 RepID=A0A8J3EUZ4_9ACTN|nr:DUF2243 domain-containing protein [Egicoccus halophilus]GGI08655.1 membrane protein [Egicoccus halophilus]
MAAEPTTTDTADGRVFVAGALTFGFGLGGLADGIVLHQVLQWHNLVSSRVPRESQAALEQNLFWDGVFHLATTIVLVVGVLLLHRGWERQDRATGNLAALAGLSLLGWGAFHAVDQLVFHLLLDVHDIRQGVANPGVYNWGFFAIGGVLAAAGCLLLRTRGRIGR